MKKNLLYILPILFSLRLFSQEATKPLNFNINYFYDDIPSTFNNKLNFQAQKSNSVSLFLPFLDDFYYSTTMHYPNQNLWMDSSAYINSGFAIAPPSIGVATFDGLNKHGYPYQPNLLNLTLSFSADTLTSRPINLSLDKNLQPIDTSSKVALSFYYQARGNGDPPEPSDSLVLDFFKPQQKTWTRIWWQRGSINPNLNDTVFKRIYVPLKDTAYFRDGFKFRFRNSASTGGDFDHWNIDYVYLDKSRNISDSIYFDDASITMIPPSFLTRYSSMPYQQYNNSEMASKYSLKIRNNYSSTKNLQSGIRYFKAPSTFLQLDTTKFDNINPYSPALVNPVLPAGLCNSSLVAVPSIKFQFPALTDSTDFVLKHFIRLGGSAVTQFTQNDTVIALQAFRNYYAFDDGSAEAGYYINGAGGKMAVKITLNVGDTLQALRIYFEPVGNVGTGTLSAQNFTIHVWDGDANGPMNILFKDVQSKVKYISSGFKEFPEYKLNSPLYLTAGTYYIGFQQGVAAGISVGFDKNNDFKNALYYNSGNGWTQSQITGAIMIRPVFGKKIPPPLAVQKISKVKNFEVYPVPSCDYFIISSEQQGEYTFELRNLLGQKILEEKIENTLNTVRTNLLIDGVYSLIIKEKGKAVQQQKIIIQH